MKSILGPCSCGKQKFQFEDKEGEGELGGNSRRRSQDNPASDARHGQNAHLMPLREAHM